MASVINNGIPLINGMLYSWADIVAAISGVPLTGITGIEYADSQDVVNKYGAGRHPVGRAKGRITPTAKNHPVSGGSGSHTGTVPERPHSRPCTL